LGKSRINVDSRETRLGGSAAASRFIEITS
jgi:hypothetical protein